MIKKFFAYFKKKHVVFIDIFGIGVFLCILAVIFLFFSRTSDYVTVLVDVTRDENLGKNYVDMYSNVPFWFADSIASASVQKKNIFGQTELEIVNVYYPDDGEKTKNVLVEIKVKCIFDEKTGQYTYNGMPLLVGSIQRFRMENILINGVIREIYTSKVKAYPQKDLHVDGYLDPLNYPPFTLSSTERIPIGNFEIGSIDGIPLYISQKLQKGMNMEDSSGNIIAEIIDIQKIQGKKTIFSNGQYVIFSDENREKVQVRLTVKVGTYHNKYYFMDSYPILIGNILPLTVDNIRLPVTITDIE